MTKLYFIRHCEGEGNACRRSQTLYDGLVTTKGIAQTEALRQRFHEMPIDAIYSSDSYRARATADPLSADHGLQTRYRILLREYSVGIWDGFPTGNVPRLFPEIMEHNTQNPGDLRFPGGDTYESIERRAREVLERLLSEHQGETVLIVTHALMIRILLCYAAGLRREQVNEIEYGDNTAVSLIVADGVERPRIAFMADASHLPLNLRRTWSGTSSAKINMEVNLCRLPEDKDQLLRFTHLMRSSGDLPQMQDTDIISDAHRRLAWNPDYIAFFLLEGEPRGVLYMTSHHTFPDDHAVVEDYYLDPALRENEFDLQLLGHAIHTARKENKRYLVFPAPRNSYDDALVERFSFEPIAGHADFVRLRVTIPGCQGPII